MARSLLAALTALDNSAGEDENEGPDPHVIKDFVALLGNANFRLNDWRQKRFSEFLTGPIILVPRAYDPSGLRQESRALGATILK